jgi:single-stranded DNA-binding protein
LNQLNEVNIAGIIDAIEENYTRHNQRTGKNEKFYTITVMVPRFSENFDWVPVVATEKLVKQLKVQVGDKIAVLGTMRTRNYGEKTHHVSVYTYASDIFPLTDEEYDDIENKNIVRMEGIVCKQPNHRTVNSGRIITDLLVANNRQCFRRSNKKYTNQVVRKSSYFPCIAWGAISKAASHLQVGQAIEITGRFQSRKFRRRNDTLDEYTTYEISMLDYELIDSNDNSTEEK